jgi:hypothetical protein
VVQRCSTKEVEHQPHDGRRAAAAAAHGVSHVRFIVSRGGYRSDQRYGRVELGDLEDFAAPPDSADLVTCRLALHYVENIHLGLNTVARCLAPGAGS